MPNTKGLTKSISTDELITIAETLIHKAKQANENYKTIEIERALNGLNYAKESGCVKSIEFAIELLSVEIEDYRELNK